MPLKRALIEIEKLKDALAYAEAIIDTIHEPLVVLHSDLRVRTANRAFYKTFKLIPGETEGKLIYQLDNGQWNIPQLKKNLERILVSKTNVRDFELKHYFKKTGEKIMCFNGRKLILEGEKEPMVLLIIEDVTARKKYEKQVEKEKNILTENYRLQNISRQKDDFIGMASHELKTPVTSIKAFAQLLERDFVEVGNAEAAKMLSRMNIQIVKLTNLIGDLLDVTRMEGGKLQYHLSYFDLPYITIPRLFFAMASFAFAVYMVPGLWGAPLKGISAFVPPMGTQDFTSAVVAREQPQDTSHKISDTPHPTKYYDHMKIYEPDVVTRYGMVIYYDYEEALGVAKKLHKPLMLDFTGINCVNCRKMEGQVWSDPAVMKRLKENFVIVSLYIDVHNIYLQKNEQYFSKELNQNIETLGDRNVDLQVSKYNANTQPFYFFLDGNENRLAPDGYGYDPNVKKFIQLLDSVMAAYNN